jgi:hypothetical protein
MNRTSKDSSYFSGVLDLLRGKHRKTKATAARKSAARVLAKKKQIAPAETHAYRAAEIACEPGACAAATAMSEKRFLLHEVPRIPLADCTSRKCTCSYVRYKDRRSWTTNRRAEFSMHTRLYATHGNTDRRQKIGRRADDRSSVVDYDFSNWT